MSFKNYYTLKRFSLFNRYKYYVYIDTLTYSADQLFRKNKLGPIKFMREYHKLESHYAIITCRIKTKDVINFEKAMEELKNNMLIMNYSDYEDFCKEFQEKVIYKMIGGKNGEYK